MLRKVTHVPEVVGLNPGAVLDGDDIFYFDFVVKLVYCLFVKTKINEKEARICPLFNKNRKKQRRPTGTHAIANLM